MESLPSVRMTANLNSLIMGWQRIEQAERAILGTDVAHHVVDPDSLLGLDPLQATSLDEALELLRTAEPEGWFLALPVPGALAPFRGPAPFNHAALQQGEAVVASSAGLGLVPLRVGPAVQWRVYAAERPVAPTSPYDAERALNEVGDRRRRAAAPAGRRRRPAPPAGGNAAARPRLQHPPALHG